MKNIFWTTIFWLVIVVLFWFYVKSYNQDLWSQITAWLGNTWTIVGVSSDTSDSVLSGVNWIQTMLETMNTKLDDIATKLWTSTSNTENISTSTEIPTMIWTGTK